MTESSKTPAAEKTKTPAASKTAAAVDVNAAIASGIAPANLEADAKFYCPACGLRHDAEGTCTGMGVAPHQPTPVVSTKELAGDADKHTAAPASE